VAGDPKPGTRLLAICRYGLIQYRGGIAVDVGFCPIKKEQEDPTAGPEAC
jgi:hypothetical protein